MILSGIKRIESELKRMREWGERGEEKKKPKRLFHLQLLLFYVYT